MARYISSGCVCPGHIIMYEYVRMKIDIMNMYEYVRMNIDCCMNIEAAFIFGLYYGRRISIA